MRTFFKSWNRTANKNSTETLIDYCNALLNQQKIEWKLLSDAYKGLEQVKLKEVDCGNYRVKIQFNPQRITSTTADTTPEILSKRKCFLCLDNLPSEQRGILYNEKYLILCNPAPIFSKHFTVIDVLHVEQNFVKSINTLIELAEDLSPYFTVFYNGPKGGASAPDHMHFQVVPRGEIPVELDAVDTNRRAKFYHKENVAGFRLINYDRSVLIIESANKNNLLEFLLGLIKVWKDVLSTTEEPIMNVLCSYENKMWRIIIFLRSKHRPDVYFKKGDERIVVSPAAVDIGGFIVTPLEKDFLRLDAKLIKSIFTEVSEKEEVVLQIMKEIS